MLFKKSTPVSCSVGDDLSYMNLEKKEIENEEKLKPLLPPPLDLHDRKVIIKFNKQYMSVIRIIYMETYKYRL